MKTISKKYRSFLRRKINKYNIQRLENKDCTIISSNCVGGVILHELGLPFNTPTIDLWFFPDDYLKFISNLREYIAVTLEDATNEMKNLGYPVGRIKDVYIFFTHYHSFTEAKKKWDERKKRIRWDNIYFILVERDGCTEDIINKFDSLPFEHKAILGAKERKINSNYYIEDSVENNQVRDLCEYTSVFSGERWIDRWDYVAFLNGK